EVLEARVEAGLQCAPSAAAQSHTFHLNNRERPNAGQRSPITSKLLAKKYSKRSSSLSPQRIQNFDLEQDPNPPPNPSFLAKLKTKLTDKKVQFAEEANCNKKPQVFYSSLSEGSPSSSAKSITKTVTTTVLPSQTNKVILSKTKTVDVVVAPSEQTPHLDLSPKAPKRKKKGILKSLEDDPVAEEFYRRKSINYNNLVPLIPFKAKEGVLRGFKNAFKSRKISGDHHHHERSPSPIRKFSIPSLEVQECTPLSSRRSTPEPSPKPARKFSFSNLTSTPEPSPKPARKLSSGNLTVNKPEASPKPARKLSFSNLFDAKPAEERSKSPGAFRRLSQGFLDKSPKSIRKLSPFKQYQSVDDERTKSSDHLDKIPPHQLTRKLSQGNLTKEKSFNFESSYSQRAPRKELITKTIGEYFHAPVSKKDKFSPPPESVVLRKPVTEDPPAMGLNLRRSLSSLCGGGSGLRVKERCVFGACIIVVLFTLMLVLDLQMDLGMSGRHLAPSHAKIKYNTGEDGPGATYNSFRKRFLQKTH
ncbi:PREDICTED: uncharacterized protein LOC108558423, partial [Nicrophorus vespilloides]|uniref:Uncharacterized protein LOC108558423 n=1 Tax=Nicrophorus vespilloides TaxID=110193 RepID=A0ABM1M8D0_NICVS